MTEYRKELGEGYFGFDLPTQVNYTNVQKLMTYFQGIYQNGVQQQGSTDSWRVGSANISDLIK